MRRAIIVVGLLTLLVTQTGCDSNMASRSNFKSALQAVFDEKPRCASWAEQLPADLNAKAYDYKQRVEKYEALKAAGLLVSGESMKAPQDPLGAAFGMKQQPIPTMTYSVGGANRGAWSGKGEVCYAKVHVTSVDNFTEPAESMGFKMSQVSYSYELVDIASWAANSAVQRAIPQIKIDLLQTEHKGTENMVLTANGWKTAQDTR